MAIKALDFINQTQFFSYYITVLCFLFNFFFLFRDPTALKGKYAKEKGQFPCLAEYGGPVDPNTALGGFPG